MDSYEASSLIFTKVKSIDPENATKIMGYILIQDLAEKDLMRLAFGPDNLLHSMVIRARIHLGLSSNASSTPSSPSTLNPIARPSSLAVAAGNPFSQSSPRVPNGFPSSPSPSSPSTHSWPLSGLSGGNAAANSPKSSPFVSSYDGARFPPAFSNGGGGEGSSGGELIDESHLSDYLSFLSEDLEFHPDWAHSNGDSAAHFHRRSFSASDASFCSDEFAAGGFKPCLYFARGFCKNGSTCKFVHGGGGFAGDQAEADHHDDLMRLKAAAAAAAAAQQQRLMALSPSVYNKYMNLLLQQQQQQQQQQNDPQRAAAMMMGEEIYKFGRCRPERNDFLSMAEKMNSASRQIYLTFPAESTFKDEDVSEYFNKFGPVQDVRIPYQQKRMFGFVTFVHPETVRFILSKGNPHFICDSRVLVKPYKEKGKVLDKRQQHQQQQFERGDFSSCSSPDSREGYDFPIGGRMFYNAQDILLRRKLEQAELQQAIELQGRRVMNLQLPEFKNDRLHHHQRSLSVGASVLLPQQSFSPSSQSTHLPFDTIKQEVTEGHDDSPVVTVTLPSAVSSLQHQRDKTSASVVSDGNDQVSIKEDIDLHKSVEQVLPDNLFASPTKSSGDCLFDFLTAASEEVNESAATPNEPDSPLPSTSAGF